MAAPLWIFRGKSRESRALFSRNLKAHGIFRNKIENRLIDYILFKKTNYNMRIELYDFDLEYL